MVQPSPVSRISRRPALIIGSIVKIMPGTELFERARPAVVQHLRLLVEVRADAVAAELAHHREAGALGEVLDRVADVAQAHAGLDLDDAVPHRLVGDLAQALGGDRAFADDEHAAGVAVPAVLDDGDVDVDDVAVLQRPVVRDAVADLVVDRGAERLRVGRVARRRVVSGAGMLPCTLTM